MTSARPGAWRRLADADGSFVTRALRTTGLWLDLGAASVRLHSDCEAMASQLQVVYGEFPLSERGTWADVHVRIDRARGLRRWVRPQVVLHCDAQQPFEPFPADSALPLFEWGCNWLIAQRLHDLLLLHAGVVERDGLALLLPATPGSGKSTLTAALAMRGWRLLSDEFGAFDLASGALRAMLKPIALKNQSIDVIRAFAPHAVVGPVFPRTRKGAVAHLAPPSRAVAQRHEGARPGAVVLPRWEAGSATRWKPLPADTLFSSLAFNAFNYELLGADGFRAVVQLARGCPGWELIYSDLDDALRTIDAAWPRVLEHHRADPA